MSKRNNNQSKESKKHQYPAHSFHSKLENCAGGILLLNLFIDDKKKKIREGGRARLHLKVAHWTGAYRKSNYS